jgi:hypothetical protein
MLDQMKHDYELTLKFSVTSHEEDAADALEQSSGWAEAVAKLELALEELKQGNKLAMKADCVDSTRLLNDY